MKRREFITLLGGTAATWPLAARAQQAGMPVIGALFGVSKAEWVDSMAGFSSGLRESGFVEARNVATDYRWAEGQFDRLPAMAADLIGRKPTVILAGGSDLATVAVMAATKTIPIIFATAGDPVRNGFVPSLNRPGGNATGVTFLGRELEPKRLELLHEVIPTANKIALLVNPNNRATSQDVIERVQAGAQKLGLVIIVLSAGDESGIENAFAAAVQQHAAALFVGEDAYLVSRRTQIAALGLRYALATMAPTRVEALSGALMSYGSSRTEMYRQVGTYVGRVLKGDKPADLPVIQPIRFELIVNLKTAKAIGLSIPETFLVRADEVIE
jgi:putative ABC transport system substrate-binding protein